MKLFWDEAGPAVLYREGLLHIEDLNPHVETRWRMSRWEMVKFGVKAVFAGMFSPRL